MVSNAQSNCSSSKSRVQLQLIILSISMNLSRLILACRNIEKGQTAKSTILKSAPTNSDPTIDVCEIDLSSYASVLAFSKQIKQLPRLDGFIANAGVEKVSFDLCEGLEQTLTVNVVSTMLSCIAVLPKLEQTAIKHKTNTNLSVVGSLIHVFGPDSQLDVAEGQFMLNALSGKKTADVPSRYPLSKLLIHHAFHSLSSIIATHNSNVICNLVNPGWCATELARDKGTMPFAQRMAFAVMGRTAEQGGRTLTHGVLAGSETAGKYLSECQIKEESAYMHNDRAREHRDRLWEELMEIYGRVAPDVLKGIE